MLVRNWITEHIGSGYINFERLRDELLTRAEDAGLDVSAREIRVVLEKLISNGNIETCQFLAEDQCYRPTVYDDSNIYWYWFRVKAEASP
jgi:hypothetical protein